MIRAELGHAKAPAIIRSARPILPRHRYFQRLLGALIMWTCSIRISLGNPFGGQRSASTWSGLAKSGCRPLRRRFGYGRAFFHPGAHSRAHGPRSLLSTAHPHPRRYRCPNPGHPSGRAVARNTAPCGNGPRGRRRASCGRPWRLDLPDRRWQRQRAKRQVTSTAWPLRNRLCTNFQGRARQQLPAQTAFYPCYLLPETCWEQCPALLEGSLPVRQAIGQARQHRIAGRTTRYLMGVRVVRPVPLNRSARLASNLARSRPRAIAANFSRAWETEVALSSKTPDASSASLPPTLMMRWVASRGRP
jgi:hypothetical protein